MPRTSLHDLAVYSVNEMERGAPANEISERIASVLLDEKRTKDTATLMRAIEKELANRGVSIVHITSAFPVEESVQNTLADMLGAVHARFITEVDPQVIGGVRARTGSKEIDLTVRGKLQKFKKLVARA